MPLSTTRKRRTARSAVPFARKSKTPAKYALPAKYSMAGSVRKHDDANVRKLTRASKDAR